MLCDGTGNVLAHGEITRAAGMMLGFNLSDSVAWVRGSGNDGAATAAK